MTDLPYSVWLLVGVSLSALKRCAAGMWCSNNNAKACGVFFTGRKMLHRPELTAAEPLAALLDAILHGSRKMGITQPAGRLTGRVAVPKILRSATSRITNLMDRPAAERGPTGT